MPEFLNPKILEYGILGLIFACIACTYFLLRSKENELSVVNSNQSTGNGNDKPRLASVYAFMVFTVFLCVAAIISEAFMSTDKKEDLEEEIVQLKALTNKCPTISIDTSYTRESTGQGLTGVASITIATPGGKTYTSGEKRHYEYVEHRDENIGDAAKHYQFRGLEFARHALQEAEIAINELSQNSDDES